VSSAKQAKGSPVTTKLKRPKSSLSLGLPSKVAQDFRDYKNGKLALTLKTQDPEEMETFFAEEGVSFKTRVFDLGMMNYRLLGGRVHQLIHRHSAFFVYNGEDGNILVCQMYLGRINDLPAGALRRENKGIQFYIYRMNGLTVAFWQEGTVTCVLTSDIVSEELLQLAFAKAVKV